MVLALDTYHTQQVNISRSGTYEAVNQCIALQHIVNQQWVRSRDITMYAIIVNTITVSIVAITVGCTHLVIENPCRVIVSLDGRLHQKCTTEHVGYITVKTLDIL